MADDLRRDPAHIAEPAFAPPIKVEEVLVNRQPMGVNPLEPFVSPNTIQFEYRSLSLRAPENVRFRYRLEGYDKDWVNAGTQRRASYGSLRPGAYRFRVIGSSGEGVWNTDGAEVRFRVTAPFYERTPFLSFAVAAVIVFSWLIHRDQLGLELKRARLQVEAQSNERLRIARDMHDTFLQGVQAGQIMLGVALELMEQRPVKSRSILQRAIAVISESTEDARRTVSALRTLPGGQDLQKRIERLSEKALPSSVPAEVRVEALGKPRELSPAVDDDVYHIVFEALHNARKHASASEIRIVLNFEPREFQVVVADNGVGIDSDILQRGPQGHFGLIGMHERAQRAGGSLEIESVTGVGTRIRVFDSFGVCLRLGR